MATAMDILKARIETALWRNRPKQYRQLQKSGQLSQYLESRAQAAAQAMDATTGEANESQREELAREYLNPPLEAEPEESEPLEASPEEQWLSRRTKMFFPEPRVK